MGWTKRIPFKVSVAGIIELMGTSLYSRLDTPIRELVQNAHDAISRTRQVDLAFRGRIDVEQDAEAGELRVTDDGTGLSADDAERYLGTLGLGITGMLRRGQAPEDGAAGDGERLIGQFGIGLFSAFMIADRIIVESRRHDREEGVRWSAGPTTEIELSSFERERPGTTVRLLLKPDCRPFCESAELVEASLRHYAEFVDVPIHLNGGAARVNTIDAPWFAPTPEPEELALALEAQFGEAPLDVLPVHQDTPVSISGALYISPDRTPGFSGRSLLTATVRRMVISREIPDLLPPWATFVRGIVALDDCAPVTSREDLVRDKAFATVGEQLEAALFAWLERLADEEPARLQALISWHRYSLAGAALAEPRLRALLARSYRFLTTDGELTFQQLYERSHADPLVEAEADRVVWLNGERRQEAWVGELFAGREAVCVHALRAFEESLLAALVSDAGHESGEVVDMRVASPRDERFAAQLLDVRELTPVDASWQAFLAPAAGDARILQGRFDPSRPVMAFIDERHDLRKTFEELKRHGEVPSNFQRLIDQHFERHDDDRNQLLLNLDHRLVARALERSTSAPLASVLRLLVSGAMVSAGAAPASAGARTQSEDLDWIAEALWGRDAPKEES